MKWTVPSLVALTFWVACSTTFSQINDESKQTLDRITQKAIVYLESKGQADDGTFSSEAGPGITALVVTGLIRNGVELENPTVAKGLKALEGFVKPDGGIYGNGRLMNYETCVAILCFAEANKKAGDGRYAKLLANAKSFLSTMQYGEATGETIDSPEYGGAGYAGKGRPDLSNTAYLLEALKSLETDANDPAVQRALVFVSRCQNLASSHNKNELAAKVNDGGFFYTIPTEKELESADRNSPNGGLRSYGSMTYSGFKSMIYAGLKKDDIRVKSALDWIAKHYTLTENPGMGTAGLFYYYHTFGAAMNAAGQASFADDKGVEHNWRAEIIDRLAKTQQDDGSWQNENKQWFENDKNLSTAFALLTLGYCRN